MKNIILAFLVTLFYMGCTIEPFHEGIAASVNTIKMTMLMKFNIKKKISGIHILLENKKKNTVHFKDIDLVVS